MGLIEKKNARTDFELLENVWNGHEKSTYDQRINFSPLCEHFNQTENLIGPVYNLLFFKYCGRTCGPFIDDMYGGRGWYTINRMGFVFIRDSGI